MEPVSLYDEELGLPKNLQTDDSQKLTAVTDSYEHRYSENARNGFIRKVYGILTVQLMITVGMSCLFMFHEPTRLYTQAHSTALILGTFIPLFVIMCVLICTKLQHAYPWNLLFLGIFTALQSVGIACVCGAYYEAGHGQIVLAAFSITAIIFLGLTLFTLQSKYDFGFLGAGLGCGIMILLLWGLINAIFGWHTTFLYSLFGALLFCGFILYDTSALMNTLSYDDYIVAALSLYLDVLNLFLFILQLLGRRD